MTTVITVLVVVVALLTLLVAGLLRSHAEILRRLHELGAGITDGDAVTPTGMPQAAAARAEQRDARPRRPARPTTTSVTAHRPAHDLVGRTLAGDPVGVSVTGVAHDTVLLFLSSGCATCEAFWSALDAPRGRGGIVLPGDARLVVVTRGPAHESPAALAHLVPAGTTLVMTDEAWDEYDVSGTPYVVHVEGGTGRIRGEGTGMDWPQVARLLAQATGDLAYVGRHGRARKAAGDAARERRIDDELIAAGILPGDERLYPVGQPQGDDVHDAPDRRR